MTILRYPATKANGLPCPDNWYVANEYADGTFTITLSRSAALKFYSDTEANQFNERQMRLGHITEPFIKQREK